MANPVTRALRLSTSPREFFATGRKLGVADNVLRKVFTDWYGADPDRIPPGASLYELAKTAESNATLRKLRGMVAGWTPYSPVAGTIGTGLGALKTVAGVLGAGGDPDSPVPPPRPGSPDSPAFVNRTSDLMTEAAKGYLDMVKAAEHKPFFETAIESARSLMVAPLALAGAAARPAAGLAPYGHTGPYNPFRGGVRAGEKLTADVAGSAAGQAASLVTQPGKTLHADPAIAAIAAGAGSRLVRGAGEAVAPVVYRSLDAAEPQAFRGVLGELTGEGPGTISPAAAKEAFEKRYPNRPWYDKTTGAYEAPRNVRVGKRLAVAAARGIAVGALGDLPGPVGALIGAAAPEFIRAVFARIPKDKQASFKRAMSQWWHIGDADATEPLHSMVRKSSWLRSAVEAQVRELASRVRREPVQLVGETKDVPFGEIARVGVGEGGALTDAPTALHRERQLKEYASAVEGAVAGSEAGAAALRKEVSDKFSDRAAEVAQARKDAAEAAAKVPEARAAAEKALAAGKEGVPELKKEAASLREKAAEERAKAVALRTERMFRKRGAKVSAEDVRQFSIELRKNSREASALTKSIASDIKDARKASKESADPRLTELVRTIARAQRRAASELRAAAAIRSKQSFAVYEGSKRARVAEQPGAAKVAEHTGAAARYAAEAADKYREAIELARAGRSQAKPFVDALQAAGERSKTLREKAVAMRDALKAETAPYVSKAAELTDAAERLRDQLEQDKAVTPEQRSSTAGRIEQTEVVRKVQTLTDKPDINSGIDRVVESWNSLAPEGGGVPREWVAQRILDSMTADGATLLYDAGVRGSVYQRVLRALPEKMPAKEKARFRQELDDRLVDAADRSLTSNPERVEVELPDGSVIKVSDLVTTAVKEMEKADPKRAREWRANAMEKAGAALGAVLEKRATVQALMSEFDRFSVRNKKGRATEGRRWLNPEAVDALLAKGQPPPVAAAEALVRHLPQRLREDYTSVRGLAAILSDMGAGPVPTDIMMRKGAAQALRIHLQTLGMIGEAPGVAQKLGRMGKTAYTALNLGTSKGNILANLTMLAIQSGDPVGVGAGVVRAVRDYGRFKRGEMTGRQLLDFRDLVETGFVDTTILDDVMSDVGRFAKSERPLVYTGTFLDEAQKLGRASTRKGVNVTVRGYRAQDTMFKLYTALRNQKRLSDQLSRLGEGRTAEVELRDGRIARLVKRKGKLVRGSRALSDRALRKLVAEAAVVPGLNLFFDYTGGGAYLQWIRRMPVFGSITQPFFAWQHFATDIPGIKKGLLAHILGDDAGLRWTDDPVLRREGADRAVALTMRRLALLSAGRAVFNTTKDAGLVAQAAAHDQASPYPVAVTPGDNNGVGWSLPYRQEYVIMGAETLWRAGHHALSWFAGDERPKIPPILEKAMPFVDWKQSMDRMWQIRRKAMQGRVINPSDVVALAGFGGHLLEGIYDNILSRRGYGRREPIRVGDIIMDATTLLFGGTPMDIATGAASALVDPYERAYGRRYLALPDEQGPEPVARYLLRHIARIGATPFATREVAKRHADRNLQFFRKGFMSALKKRIRAVKRDTTIPITRRDALLDELEARKHAIRRLEHEIRDELRAERQRIKEFGGGRGKR